MDILTLLEAKGFSPVHVGGNEYKIPCLNQAAHDDGLDSNWSFNINIEKNVGHCLACGYALNEAAMTKWLLGDELDDFQLAAMEIRGKLKRLQGENEPFLRAAEEFTLMPPSVPWEKDYRNLSAEFYGKIGARYCTVGRYANRIIFPIYVNGRLRGFDSRALGDEKPKYLRSKGFNSLEEGLYPLDIVRDMRPTYIILCEGIYDALNAVFHGFPALCIFGTSFSMQKFALLLSTGCTEVVLMLDNDSAGQGAAERIIAEIKDWITVSVGDRELLSEYLTDDGKIKHRDLGDLNAEEIQFCVDNRRRVR